MEFGRNSCESQKIMTYWFLARSREFFPICVESIRSRWPAKSDAHGTLYRHLDKFSRRCIPLICSICRILCWCRRYICWAKTCSHCRYPFRRPFRLCVQETFYGRNLWNRRKIPVDTNNAAGVLTFCGLFDALSLRHAFVCASYFDILPNGSFDWEVGLRQIRSAPILQKHLFLLSLAGNFAFIRYCLKIARGKHYNKRNRKGNW